MTRNHGLSDTNWFSDLLSSESRSEYQEFADRHPSNNTQKSRTAKAAVGSLIAMALVGVGFAQAAIQSSLEKPASAQTQELLLTRLRELQSNVTDVQAENSRLFQGNQKLSLTVVPLTALDRSRYEQALALSPYEKLRGSGVKIFLRQPRNAGPNSQVIDSDLQILINGLWAAGARGIEINNIRLTQQAAIRSAGGAVLVDYQPTVAPYVVKAIGPTGLFDAFLQTDANLWLEDLKANYGINFEIQKRNSLVMKAGRIQPLAESEKVQP
jgi:uncharacterized protein YlxW (UPF0749 family)